MKPSRLLAIAFIIGLATFAWFVLGTTIVARSSQTGGRLQSEVRKVWGPGLAQPHLTLAPDIPSANPEDTLPSKSEVDVTLKYQPVKRGLLWHRTYAAQFQAKYEITNRSSSSRNFRIILGLPVNGGSFENFQFQMGSEPGTAFVPRDGVVETITSIPAGGTVPLTVAYEARGLDDWAYTFPSASRAQNFVLRMRTDFDAIHFPAEATSPTTRNPLPDGRGWELEWNYRDTISPRHIAMEMPPQLNAGPVLTRISFFAPLSLIFFFGVLIMVSFLRGVNLHPLTCGFVAAGYFSFHLLLAYMGDLMPLHTAFFLAAVISVTLVCGYLHLVIGRVLSVPAFLAQMAYMVLFSYSFFFTGVTGLTLTIMGVTTLAFFMVVTAKVDWETLLKSSSLPWRKNATA